MSHYAVISSKQLFDRRNNPGQIISAGFGIFLATILERNIEKTKAAFRHLAKNEYNYRQFLSAVRQCTKLKDVEDKIRHILLFRDPRDKMSPEMEEAIHSLAISLCRDQSEAIYQEIENQLQQIKTLSEIAEDEPPEPRRA